MALTRRSRWLDPPRLCLLALGLLLLPTVYGGIGGDGRQAFVVVRSVLLDRDLELANDYHGIGSPVVATDRGTATSHLPVGLALFWAPAFLLAHLGVAVAAALGSEARADGFSLAYRSAVTTATYVYGMAALLLLEGELRRRHGPVVALSAVLAIWFATPLHFYMTANPAMAHGVSVFAATLFVIAWLRCREDGRLRHWALMGGLGGLMTLVRLQDVVLLALPAGDLLWRRPAGWPRRLAALAAAAAAAGVLQLVMWLRLFGSAFARSVLEDNLVGGTTPQVVGVLLSARHGLFYWTPAYALCVAGWLVWMRRERVVAAMAWVGFAAAVLVNASMQDWWGSEAFGQRRLLGLTPLFALGLGQALAALGPPVRAAAVAALVCLSLWTWSFEGIYNSEVVARRDQAITYGALARAQADALRRRIVRVHGRVPGWLWVRMWRMAGGGSVDRVDLGEEPAALPFLVGRGWYDPERQDGASVRLSRGPASFLRVPIAREREQVAVVRARPMLEDVPLRLTFEVNREPVGTAEMTPGWAEYRFAVPAGLLRAGLNDLGLVYSTTPRVARPGQPGRNAAVAVDWIALEPAAGRDED